MPQNELKDRILGWCSQASDITAVQDRDEGGADLALLLRVNRPEGARLGVLKPAGSDRVALIHTMMLPSGSVKLGDGAPGGGAASLGEAVERIIEARSGALSGSTRQTSDGQEVNLTYTIYDDGLSKHTFLTGIQELSRARRAVDRLHTGQLEEINPAFPAAVAAEPVTATPAGATPGGARPGAAERPALTGVVPSALPDRGATAPQVPVPTPQPQAQAAAQAQPQVPAAAQSQTAAQPQPAAQPQAAPQPQPAPAAAAWTPSHRVPPAGMDAWAVPDPTQRAIARIDGGVPVQVTETAGAWGHVLCSNGWSGWVDFRILVPAGS